ncbi:MAG: 4-(cytidine 5'-diphospho)-2-C-methyl-D-erythritol kinase, partial [Leucobacter sp.]|nr:4-(cytidine 5'-diphospho)-2-C-methyl-D-erythritol kinase [Leucobacter sp.]
SNIALRAAKLVARATGYAHGVDLHIVKRVPIAGGMGGGSADAAATLIACDELWQTGLGRSRLLPLAAELGADVPFALEGGTAIGVGRGDRLSHALAKGEYHWVLAFADEGLSTPAVYCELDRHRERNHADLPPAPESVMVDAATLQAVRAGDAVALAEAMQNDLQAAALKLRPELGETLEFGESRGALAAIVSGSGPTCAFLMPDALTASELLSAFKRAGTAAVMVTGPVQGAHVAERR